MSEVIKLSLNDFQGLHIKLKEKEEKEKQEKEDILISKKLNKYKGHKKCKHKIPSFF